MCAEVWGRWKGAGGSEPGKEERGGEGQVRQC